MKYFTKLELFKKPLVVYPFIFAIFPIIFMFAFNIKEMNFNDTLLPSALILLATIVLWSILLILLRNKYKAGLATLLFLVFFFSYGRIYQVCEDSSIFIPGHAYLLPAVLLAWGYCTYIISRAKNDFRNATTALNIITAVLLTVNIANAALYKINNQASHTHITTLNTSTIKDSTVSVKSLPDIYFVDLDEYTHPDVMKEWYGYDNSKFVNNLKDKGFYIVTNSRTRTPDSGQVIAQILNMEYLTEGYTFDAKNNVFNGINSAKKSSSGEDLTGESTYRKIAFNKVADFLRTKGYKFIYFGNAHDIGRWDSYMKDSADLYFNYYLSTETTWITEFQNILWNSTMMRPFYNSMVGNKFTNSYSRQVLATIEHLKSMPNMEGPKFVFTHLYCPHEPFVFDANGNPTNTLYQRNYQYKQYYLGQYVFISGEIDKLVTVLQKNSATLPIIIVQADHGIRPSNVGCDIGIDEWRKVFNALYLPGMDRAALYQSMSPVNTFRIIFNHYFNTNYELLPDDSD